MNEEKYQVQIPANVKVRTELINGIGIKELVITGIVGVICLIIDVPIYLISQNYLVCLIFFGILTGFTFLAVMKDKNNGCIAGLIANMYKYMKGQKFYGYVLKEKKEND